MKRLIDKDAVLAKIRGYIKNAEVYLKYHHNRNDKSVYAFEQEKLAMCELLSSLDTLEIKGIDLEKKLTEGKIVWADKVQKIREGVARLKSQLLRGACSSQVAMETRCKEEAYDEVLAILDTMQEDPNEIIDKYLYGKEPELTDEDDLPKENIEDENLQELINKLYKQFPEVSFAKLTRIAVRVARWKKEQMIAKAIDADCFGLQGDALFSFKLPANKYLVGSKVKVILIKEN
jgi:hypothetical protein